MDEPKHYPIDKITQPIQRFIRQEKAGGIILGISVIVALILANSPWSASYFGFLEQKIGFQFSGETYFNLSILHWINDGLIAIFFFVVGLELKREIVGGELSNPRKALLPIGAAIGGMLVPALVSAPAKALVNIPDIPCSAACSIKQVTTSPIPKLMAPLKAPIAPDLPAPYQNGTLLIELFIPFTSKSYSSSYNKFPTWVSI